MGLYKILYPEAVTNLVTNPSLETATTGYTAVGGSIAQSATRQRRGTYSLAVTPTAGTTDGAYYGTVALTSGTTYTFSVDFWGVVDVLYRIYFGTTGAVVKGTPTTHTGLGRWVRLSVTWQADATADHRLYIVKNTHASTGVFYVDGVLCWAADHDTSYVDGDQSGFLKNSFYWTGTPHASTSVRLAQERAGGREYDLETYGFRVNTPGGLGMPPVAHHSEGLALLPGAEYTGYKIMPRVIDLAGGFTSVGSPANLHSYRKDIVDFIKPDLVRGAQPFVLRYYHPDGRGPLEMRVVYDSGLGFQPNSPIEQANIRLIAYDPYVREDGQEGAALDNNDTATIGNIFQLNMETGAFSNMNGGFNNLVYKIIRLSNGDIIATGTFTTSNGGTATSTPYIARWANGASAWTAMGTSCNGGIRYIYQDATGNLYITGDFTTAPDGTAAARIAKSTDGGTVWTAFGTGLNQFGDVILVLRDGTLVVGGAFATANGVTVNNLAKWTGSTFAPMGGTSLDGIIYSIIEPRANELYIGGDFGTAPDGDTACEQYALSTDGGTTWSALEPELTMLFPEVLFMASNGLLYSGAYTDAPTQSIIGVWNGVSWKELLGNVTDADEIVYLIVEDNRGRLWLGGNRVTGNPDMQRGVFIWNGYSFALAPFTVTSASTAVQTLLASKEYLYFGGASSTAVQYQGLTTCTNTGSISTFPVVKIKRSGGTTATIASLINYTADKTIWLDYDLSDGETITMDFRPGYRSITSDKFGDIWTAMKRNSDFNDFVLLPGANSIGLYVEQTGSPTVTSTIHWPIQHWSVDGIAA